MKKIMGERMEDMNYRNGGVMLPHLFVILTYLHTQIIFV